MAAELKKNQWSVSLFLAGMSLFTASLIALIIMAFQESLAAGFICTAGLGFIVALIGVVTFER